MDFNKFKVETKSNSATVDSNSSLVTNVKLSKINAELLNHKQVYQICSTCNYGTIHYIIQESCKCSVCGRTYKLVTK